MIMVNITGRIAQVTLGMKEISSGDANLTRQIEARSHDEPGQLARCINSFALLLRDLIERVKA